MIGVTIRDNIGIGDKLQFSSLPENYFRATNQKLVDVSNSWIFDHNPYVLRNVPKEKIKIVRELWNFPHKEDYRNPRKYVNDPTVYLSNAEVHATRFNVPVVMNRPRLYRFEDFPFHQRTKILLQTHGKSHGALPEHVIKHVISKYKPTGQLFHIGLPTDPDYGIPKVATPTIWDLIELISRARMLIGPDSGPTWIAACYPDVVCKKVRLRKVAGQKEMQDWVPLEITNIHSHWDDRLAQICNPTEDDQGFMPSYRRL